MRTRVTEQAGAGEQRIERPDLPLEDAMKNLLSAPTPKMCALPGNRVFQPCERQLHKWY
jgi:hypothetical protein